MSDPMKRIACALQDAAVPSTGTKSDLLLTRDESGKEARKQMRECTWREECQYESCGMCTVLFDCPSAQEIQREETGFLAQIRDEEMES